MRVLTVVVVLACLLSLVSCKHGGPRPVADHTLSDADLPKTVEARVGETIDLALASNASTGYSWHCDWAPKAGLTKVGEGYERGASDAPGSGGTQHYVFKAAQAGKVVITVQYGRWWQGGDREPAKQVTVNITQ